MMSSRPAFRLPGAHYLAQSHNGNRILVLGSRADTVTVLAPSAVGTSTDPAYRYSKSALRSSGLGSFQQR